MATRFSESRALRTIGQELKRRGIDLFELRCLRKEYYLQCGDPNPPYVGLLEITFSDDEIVSLDAAAASGRSNDHSFVDFESLPEILRASAKYVEIKNGTLLRISASASASDQETIRLEYEGGDARLHVEQLTRPTLAETARRMYKERSRAKPAAGRGVNTQGNWRH